MDWVLPSCWRSQADPGADGHRVPRRIFKLNLTHRRGDSYRDCQEPAARLIRSAQQPLWQLRRLDCRILRASLRLRAAVARPENGAGCRCPRFKFPGLWPGPPAGHVGAGTAPGPRKPQNGPAATVTTNQGAGLSKPEPNSANHANQYRAKIQTYFRNSLREFNRHKEHSLKVYARTGICKILPDMDPNFLCAKGLDRPEIGLHARGVGQKLAQIRVSFYSFQSVYMIVMLY